MFLLCELFIYSYWEMLSNNIKFNWVNICGWVSRGIFEYYVEWIVLILICYKKLIWGYLRIVFIVGLWLSGIIFDDFLCIV